MEAILDIHHTTGYLTACRLCFGMTNTPWLCLFASRETAAIMSTMESTHHIYWQDRGQWLGYLQDYPDYWTQGQSLEELQAHLRDLYRDLTSGDIPGVRKLAELTLQ
jgi:hypothetical protein